MRAVHLPAAAVLGSTVDLLRLRGVLTRCLGACRLVPNGWQLRTAMHLRRHHVLLVLPLLRRRLAAILAVACRFLALAFLFLLALVVFLLLLGLPLFPNLFEL